MPTWNQDTVTLRGVTYTARPGQGNCWGVDGQACESLQNHVLCRRAPCVPADRQDGQRVIFLRAEPPEAVTK